MSMFDNIVFDEFTLLEGEQAEAYKKKKEEEKENAYRHARRDMQKAQEYNLDAYKKDRRAQVDAANKVDKHIKHFNGTTEKLRDAQVAVKSVYKRNKAKHEAAMMMIEAYESEFAY